MNHPLISIIVPVYNVERYIKKCLDSLINQTYKNLQIVIVDDGSQDSSIDIVKTYIDNRIKLIHQKNGGLSAARNTGIKESDGVYLTFVDSDDWLALNAIELMVSSVVKYDADIVVGKERYILEGENYDLKGTLNEEQLFNGDDCLSELFKICVPSFSCAKLIRSTIIKSNGLLFPIGRNYEDNATSYLFFQACSRLVEIDAIIYYYLNREGSIVHTKNLKNLRSLVSNVKEMSETEINNRYWGFYKARNIYEAYVYALRLPQELKETREYKNVLNEIDFYRHSLKFEKNIVYYMFTKNFYKACLIKTPILKHIIRGLSIFGYK